jgi:hypothetical protein
MKEHKKKNQPREMQYTCDPIEKIHVIWHIKKKRTKKIENKWKHEMEFKHTLPCFVYRKIVYM